MSLDASVAPAPRPTASPSALTAWADRVAAHGLTLLPASHHVPPLLWLRGPDALLQFGARGTRVWLHRYPTTALTTLILRAECDCAEHRTAGAGHRSVLAPGTTPLRTVEVDGAAEFGWTGVEAGRLGVGAAAPLLDRLLRELGAS